MGVLKTTHTLQVANVEEALFHNLRSTSINAEENFFAEHSIAPNNFAEEGTVGVFAGYQLTEKEISLNSKKHWQVPPILFLWVNPTGIGFLLISFEIQ